MVRIKPFKGVRYNTEKVKMSDVVTQPYDKISDELRAEYYSRSQYTTAKLIKNNAADPYQAAATDFKSWQENGILKEEEKPAIYAYYQEYQIDGVKKVRKGLISLVGLETFDKKIIFPHERTLSGPKVDRLNLMRATNASFGQIFMLYSDQEKKINGLLDAAIAGRPADELAVDHFGDTHKLWKIDDEKLIGQVTALMADKTLLIADGHHRYDTACNFARENGQEPGTEGAFAYGMMTLINMDDEGLTVLPTHRLVYALADFSETTFLQKAEPYFAVTVKDSLADIQQAMAAQREQNVIGFYAGAKYYLLALKNSAAMDELIGERHSVYWKKLDVAVLHTIIMEKILGISQEKQAAQTNLAYVRSAEKAVESVKSGKYQGLFLLNYTDVHQVEAVATAGDVMPQKSTDFYPKLLSGMVFYKIK